MLDSSAQNPQHARSPDVRVWDVPVRIVHWLLVILVICSWITSEIAGTAMTYHMWSGYAILALVVFRILWGFVGSEHARFASFVRGPVAVVRYLCGLPGRESVRYVGHNPAGGWSVLLLLLSLLLQATTGLFANDDIFVEGPLASRVSHDTSALLTAVHQLNFYVLLGLIGLHLAAVLFYILVKRENLIGAMFTGRKRPPAGAASAHGRIASAWLAVTVFAIAAGLVALVVNAP